MDKSKVATITPSKKFRVLLPPGGDASQIRLSDADKAMLRAASGKGDGGWRMVTDLDGKFQVARCPTEEELKAELEKKVK